jgi:hypothetical protein
MGEQETDSALVGHIGAAGDAALIAQIEQIAAHILLFELIRRPAVIGGKRFNAPQVNVLGGG